MNKEEALDILEKLSLKIPFDIIDWCKSHPSQAHVVDGRVGLFSLMRHIGWDGPYSINFKACGRELVYNMYFKDIAKSVDIILHDFFANDIGGQSPM